MSIFRSKSRAAGIFMAGLLATMAPQALYAACGFGGDPDGFHYVWCTSGELVCTTVWYGSTLTYSQCKYA